MGSKTKIEWCDASWNPVTGCTPVSIGCEKCYAKRLAGRFPQIHGFKAFNEDDCNPIDDFPIDFSEVHCHPDRLSIPLHWRKPKKIFVCSMGDLFHGGVNQNFRSEVYDVMRECPQHTFMVLTKRPENIASFYNHLEYERNLNPVLPNLWLGVTCENQEMLDLRLPTMDILGQISAVQFISAEPMLGPLNIDYSDNLDWVICGPETGPGAQPFSLDWARSLRDQCIVTGVPFFYKRGELDGQLWQQFPEAK